MNSSFGTRSTALALIVALAGCGGSGVGASAPVIPSQAARAHPATILSSIVGVGDSLTAGYQSNGFLGAHDVENPNMPGVPIPVSQENGWWPDLYEQASGMPVDEAIDDMYDPKTSPLPLIANPGLNNQLIPYNTSFPFTYQKTGNICTDNHGFNLAGYRLKGLSRVRMDPTSTNIRDVGIPGITLHEANVLHQPPSDTCYSIPGIPGLLNLVVADESETFWPVLGGFTHLGPNLTEVNAAASQHPTLATVWLGANDVLKYMGSGGRFVGGDNTPGQAEADVRAAVTTLQRAGAKVVVANLPNILEAGYFQRMDAFPTSNAKCRLATYASCLVTGIGGLYPQAVPTIAKRFGLTTPGGCEPTSITKPCGYLTVAGSAEMINYSYQYPQQIPDFDCAIPAPKCKPVAGSGLGNYYITPAFAAKVQTLNNAINEGIDDAATASHVPLVNVEAIFSGLASGNPSDPYFKLAASIHPPYCCSIGFLWGIFSFDGLHPSNTGYALIAYEFISTINKAYGTHIPQIDVKAVYDGTRCSNRQYCFPDPYAPPHDVY